MRYCHLILFFLLCSGITLAGVPADRWQVTKLQLNRPALARNWYGSNSPLNRGLHIQRGYIAVYAVEVLSGLQYTLQVTALHHLQGIRAYLYDRWPLLPGAHQIALPNGPVVLTPHTKHITYRWRLGISAHSTGNMLYIVVRSPRNPGYRSRYELHVVLRSPPIAPHHILGHGITYLNGPRNFYLYGGAYPMSYALQPLDLPKSSQELSDAAGFIDLVSNGLFRQGMKNWLPDGTAASDKMPSINAMGLRLPSNVGVGQELDADVEHADSVQLQIDFRLDPLADNNADSGKGSGLAIALCYRDRQGKHCGANAHHILFHLSGKGGGAVTKLDGKNRSIAAAQWYRYQIDLMNIKPKPVRIDSISLLSCGSKGMASIREVHLFLRRSKHVMH